MDTTNAIGLMAGFLTTISFIPQALKIWRNKTARDISLGMFIAFTLGVALWLAFGVLRGEPAIIVWNAVTLLLALAILAMKFRYG